MSPAGGQHSPQRGALLAEAFGPLVFLRMVHPPPPRRRTIHSCGPTQSQEMPPKVFRRRIQRALDQPSLDSAGAFFAATFYTIVLPNAHRPVKWPNNAVRCAKRRGCVGAGHTNLDLQLKHTNGAVYCSADHHPHASNRKRYEARGRNPDGMMHLLYSTRASKMAAAWADAGPRCRKPKPSRGTVIRVALSASSAASPGRSTGSRTKH